MRDRLRVYLSGGIKNIDAEAANEWREYLKNALKDVDSKIRCFNPLDYYNYEDALLFDITEKEVFRYEINQLRKSDIVVVNVDDTTSIGTAMEVAIAYELNIPILGLRLKDFNEEEEVHPWIIECCDRFFFDKDDVVFYITNNYENF